MEKTKSYTFLKILGMGLFILLFIFCINPKIAQANELYFDEDGNLYFHTRDVRGYGGIGYKTIGWVIKRYDMPMDAPGQEYVIVTKENYKPDEIDPSDNNYVLSYFKSDKNEILGAVQSSYSQWYEILTGYGDEVYIDSVMTVVDGQNDLGTLYVGGTTTGEVYFTYEGISTARQWSKPETLKAHYNMEVTFPQIVEKWDATVEVINREYVDWTNAAFSSFVLGAGTYGNETFNVSDSIPSGEQLYIRGMADSILCDVKLCRVTARLTECVGVPVSYILRWQDYYGVQREQIRRIERYYNVVREFVYYEFVGADTYILDTVSVAGEPVNNAGESFNVACGDNIEVNAVVYGGPDKHITDYNINVVESAEYIVLYGRDGKKPAIPDADYSSKADTFMSDVMVKSDRLVVEGNIAMSDTPGVNEGSAPKISLPYTVASIYEDGITIPRETNNGVYSDCNVTLKYKNTQGTAKTVTAGLNKVIVHTPVYCEGIAGTDKELNQAVVPTRGDIVLGEEFNVTFNDFGCHNSIKGYGVRSYAKYAGQRMICCPFAVEYKGIRYEADTWIPIDGYTARLRLCEDNAEGEYVIYMQTMAYNALDDIYGNNIEEKANLNVDSYGAWDTVDVRVIGSINQLTVTCEENVSDASVMPAGINPEDETTYKISFESVGYMTDEDYMDICFSYYYEDISGNLIEADVYQVHDRNFPEGLSAGKFVDNLLISASQCEKNENVISWEIENELKGELIVVPGGTSIETIEKTANKDNIIDEGDDIFLSGGALIICMDIVSYRDDRPYLSYVNKENALKGYCNMWLREGGTDTYPYCAIMKISLGEHTYYDYEVLGTH